MAVFATYKQLQSFAHGGDVGRDVDGVGYDEQRNDNQQNPARKQTADVRGETFTRDAADARADNLDADHQRKGDQRRPQHVQPELRPGLRVGGDAAWIVVRGAGDQARAEFAQERLVVRLLQRFAHVFSGKEHRANTMGSRGAAALTPAAGNR